MFERLCKAFVPDGRTMECCVSRCVRKMRCDADAPELDITFRRVPATRSFRSSDGEECPEQKGNRQGRPHGAMRYGCSNDPVAASPPKGMARHDFSAQSIRKSLRSLAHIQCHGP